MKTAIPSPPKIFYRYVLSWQNWNHPTLTCLEYSLVRCTPKGYWIKEKQVSNFRLWREKEKWISQTSKRRYAYPTKKEACNSYIIRTGRRVDHLILETEHAADALTQAKKEIKKL